MSKVQIVVLALLLVGCGDADGMNFETPVGTGGAGGGAGGSGGAPAEPEPEEGPFTVVSDTPPWTLMWRDAGSDPEYFPTQGEGGYWFWTIEVRRFLTDEQEAIWNGEAPTHMELCTALILAPVDTDIVDLSRSGTWQVGVRGWCTELSLEEDVEFWSETLRFPIGFYDYLDEGFWFTEVHITFDG